MSSSEPSANIRHQAAEARLSQALERLELAMSTAPQEQADSALVATLQAENQNLKGLLKQASSQLDTTISQLKTQISTSINTPTNTPNEGQS